jgi:hypothetical protein
MGLFSKLFESKFDRFTLVQDEILSVLNVCNENQSVLITVVDEHKDDVMEICIDGRSWLDNPNFISELRELNHIININVKYNRKITGTII